MAKKGTLAVAEEKRIGSPDRPATLPHWLTNQMERDLSFVENKSLIDVGAYRGDFTRALLANLPFVRAILVEPHPNNLADLEPLVVSDPRITLVPMALGNARCEVDFYATNDRATGSVLAYAPAALGPQEVPASFVVQQTTLDHYLDSQGGQTPVGLLKIDTQGHDLEVLKGAEQTILRCRPWLVVELIFGPLYRGQASPEAIMSWLYARGYCLAELFNTHASDAGWLAFADAVFVPEEVERQYAAPYHAKPETTALQAQVEALQTICAERLDLINRLHAEAERRLVIIQQLEDALQQRGDE